MTDALRESEIAAEQRYLDRVYTRLGQLRVSAAEVEKAGYNLARVGNYGALVERDAMVYHAARRRRALESEHEGLVFGRLDLGPAAKTGEAAAAVEPAVPGGEVRYIGRMGLRDEVYESLVVDWRAPAAAPFYRATAADPDGRRAPPYHPSAPTKPSSASRTTCSTPTPRRPTCRVVGDGALLASISRATGRGMRDIVATIQREQDDAIRSPATGVTIVRGGPGTGKTAVALHRAAYLLYADRNRYDGGGVLVVGPSQVFVDYVVARAAVARRGHGDACARSAQLVEGMRRHPARPGGDRRDQGLATHAAGARPGRPRRCRRTRPTALRLLYRGTLLRLDRRALDELRRTVLSLRRRGATRCAAKAAGHLLDALWRQSVELLPESRQQPARSSPRTSPSAASSSRSCAAGGRVVRPMRRARLAGRARRGCAGTPSGCLSNVEITLLGGSFVRWTTAVGRGRRAARRAGRAPRRPAARGRSRADPFRVAEGVREVTTYSDRMAAARGRRERPDDYRDYAHVVVDESQDVSPMQWRMIGRRGRYASWTVVGDPAQAAWHGDAAEARHGETAAARQRGAAPSSRADHQLPELGRDLRGGRPGDPPGRARHRAARRPCARRRGAAWSAGRCGRTGRDRARGGRRGCSTRCEGTVGVITPTERRDEVIEWVAGLDRSPADGRGA